MIETFYHLSESVSAEAQGGSRKPYAPVSRSGGRSFQDYLSALKADASSSFKTAGARQTGEGVYRPESSSYGASSYSASSSYRNTLQGNEQGRPENATAHSRSESAVLHNQRREDARETEATERRQAAEKSAREAEAEKREKAGKSRSEAEKQAAKKADQKKQTTQNDRAKSDNEKAAKKTEEQAAKNAEQDKAAANKESAKAEENTKNAEQSQDQDTQSRKAAEAAQEGVSKQRAKEAEEVKEAEKAAQKSAQKDSDAKLGQESAQKSGDSASAAEKTAAQAAEQSSKNARSETRQSKESSENNEGQERRDAEEQAATAAAKNSDNIIRSSGGGQNSAQRIDGDELSPRGRVAAEQGNRARAQGENGNKLTVVDMRRDGSGTRSEESGSGGSGNSNNGNGTGESRGRSGDFSKLLQQNGLKSEKSGNDQSQTMQFDVRTAGSGAPAGEGAKSTGKASNSLFNQLRQQLGDEIVKKSTIMVRENGSGEIRLNLRPENLGSVRIRITLEDNHIAGKIFVDNQNVRDAFEQNLQNLQRSFREHGFEDASLDVSVGEERRGRHGGKKNGSAEKSVSKNAAKAMGEQVPDADSGYGDEQIIDLVV